jgi:hypothetical protein
VPAPINTVRPESHLLEVPPTALTWTDIVIGCGRIAVHARCLSQSVR